MKAVDVVQALREFQHSGRPGHVVFHYAAAGQPGTRSTVKAVEIHQRLALDAGEPDGAILDEVVQ